MPSFDISRALETVVEGYGKRMLEGKYDELAKLEFFQRLKQKSGPTRYAMELGLYLLTALFQQNFGEDSTFKRIFKEVASDSGSEVSKRLINGEKYVAEVQSLPEKILIRSVLDMELEKRQQFIKWMIEASPEEKASALKNIADLASGEISKVLEHTPEERKSFFEIFEKPPEPKKEILPLTLGVLERRLDNYISKNKKEVGDGKQNGQDIK